MVPSQISINSHHLFSASKYHIIIIFTIHKLNQNHHPYDKLVRIKDSSCKHYILTNHYLYNMERESRVVNIGLELWKRVEILAIDKGISVTEFVEEAIREKLDREKVQVQT